MKIHKSRLFFICTEMMIAGKALIIFSEFRLENNGKFMIAGIKQN